MKVGVLALQGCIEPHVEIFRSLGKETLLVKEPQDLSLIDRIVFPGGESTTMLLLLQESGLLGPLREFVQKYPVWGICAGAILLAEEVENPAQASLQAISIKAVRNYYGSQVDSFSTHVEIPLLDASIKADFIRAPLLEPLSNKVTVHARYNGQAVFCQQEQIIVTSFHPELGENPVMHGYFSQL